jgi:cyclase
MIVPMTKTDNLRMLRLTDNLIGFYAGRDDTRFMAEENWVDSGALSLGICSYVVLDDDEALVYDTHVSAAHGQVIRESLKKLHVQKITVALSHWHLDHVAGTSAFADCDIIAHDLTLAALENNRAAIEAGTHSGPPAIAPLVLPTKTYEDQLTLHVGSLEVQLRHVPAHSLDGTVLYLPDEALLLAGDTLEDTVNWVSEPETLPAQIEALDRMWGWEIERVFPNHGDPVVIEGGGYRKPLIRAGQQYLRGLQRAAREPEIAALPLKEFISGPLTAGWVNYYAPYERVHQQNLARVIAARLNA